MYLVVLTLQVGKVSAIPEPEAESTFLTWIWGGDDDEEIVSLSMMGPR